MPLEPLVRQAHGTVITSSQKPDVRLDALACEPVKRSSSVRRTTCAASKTAEGSAPYASQSTTRRRRRSGVLGNPARCHTLARARGTKEIAIWPRSARAGPGTAKSQSMRPTR